MSPFIAIWIAWGAWALSWAAGAAWSDRDSVRATRHQALAYYAPIVAGFFFLFGSVPRRLGLPWPLWTTPPAWGWALIGVAILGFLVMWWARLHLGRLWSSGVGHKAEHRIVATGPYAVVRHPIYCGITVAGFATALLRGTAYALLGAALLTFGWYVRARLEERFLRAALGAEAYDAYARRVPMLMPLPR